PRGRLQKPVRAPGSSVAGVCDPGPPKSGLRGRLQKTGLAEAGYRRQEPTGSTSHRPSPVIVGSIGRTFSPADELSSGSGVSRGAAEPAGERSTRTNSNTSA